MPAWIGEYLREAFKGERYDVPFLCQAMARAARTASGR